jgi:Raf kinase inhibitor-like YbhB/YbcL family protein
MDLDVHHDPRWRTLSEMALKLTSASFKHKGEIPARYTCEGDDVSPDLVWSGAPARTKSFALVVDDPDAPDPRAPKTIWVHWIVYDLPATVTSLAEGIRQLPIGAREGRNDWGRTGYGGPCPPVGRHRYFFKLYALDTVLGDLSTPDRATLERAMEGHLLAKAELIGTYQKVG